ncbi:hypothetical protein [Enterococcus casseliflavus]|uniref:hypothetical protein n=1 Tax=Enterococcus casseliflavus TaxID=37734 RepID=UPI000EC98BDB|nr:hypothetical protein [Enterococcus sp.]
MIDLQQLLFFIHIFILTESLYEKSAFLIAFTLLKRWSPMPLESDRSLARIFPGNIQFKIDQKKQGNPSMKRRIVVFHPMIH